MAAIINGNELALVGTVGDSWFDDSFTPADVITALAQIGRNQDIVVRLNSGGGIATDGAAIHAALSNHQGNVDVRVEGIAASAASLIAMAGDKITMAPGSVMMIHDVAGITRGNAADHQKMIEALDTLSNAYASVYADQTGKTPEEMRALMRAETWLTAEQAVDQGFAHSVGDAEAETAAIEPSAFAYGAYAKAPERFVALAHARGWKAPASPAASTASTSREKERSMPGQSEAVTTTATTTPTAADLAAIASICAQFMTAQQIEAFITGGGTLEKAKARASEVGDIRAAVANAAKINPKIEASLADDLIARQVTADVARKEILDQLVASQSAEIENRTDPGVSGDKKAEADAGWDKAVASVNAHVKQFGRA